LGGRELEHDHDQNGGRRRRRRRIREIVVLLFDLIPNRARGKCKKKRVQTASHLFHAFNSTSISFFFSISTAITRSDFS
jgi:hypothetical protein